MMKTKARSTLGAGVKEKEAVKGILIYETEMFEKGSGRTTKKMGKGKWYGIR